MQHNPNGGDQAGAGNRASGAPPILRNYSEAAQYDLATIVQQVGIRAMTLWQWEQQLRPPQVATMNEVGGAAVRNYSERDLVAYSWVRDQLLLGRTLAEAVELLMRAQPVEERSGRGVDARGESGGGIARPTVNSRPLGEAATNWGRSFYDRQAADSASTAGSGGFGLRGEVSGSVRMGPPSGPLRMPPGSDPLRAPTNSGPLRTPPGSDVLHMPRSSVPAYVPGSSGTFNRPSDAGGGPQTMPGLPMRAASQTVPLAGSVSGHLMPVPPMPYPPAIPPAPRTGVTRPDLSWMGQSAPVPVVLPGANVSAARSRPSGGLGYGDPRVAGGSGQWAAAPAPVGRELRSLVQPLLRAFVTFDTHLANALVDEALSSRSVEAVCAGLFIPVLNRVSELWGRNELSIPEERYATNFVRARLFSFFATTPEQPEAPLTVIACGPHEQTDLNALMLAMFWRRSGIRVVYLGQDVDGQALVEDVRMRRPRLVCVAITTTQRLRALARISKSVVQLDAPTPIFTYSGLPFTRNPELQRKVAGVYLGDDPTVATWHALRLLSVSVRGLPPAIRGTGMGQAG